ncbi:MAG: hypothetical protein FWF28_10550, partial [Micrococcales bacterium]|nr:hypothetical protein [Micrococcales bacterium]
MPRRQLAARRYPAVAYLALTVSIFVVSIFVSAGARLFLTMKNPFFALSDSQAAVIAALMQGAVAAVAAGLIMYQLRAGKVIEERQYNINEAQFILQYNQAFIQDRNMYLVEHRLEQWMEDEEDGRSHGGALVTESSRQNFINYLVYLEGLAPLIFSGVLRFEDIDDLMAYRFFLAVNNPELQKDQLFRYADYYRGCF